MGCQKKFCISQHLFLAALHSHSSCRFPVNVYATRLCEKKTKNGKDGSNSMAGLSRVESCQRSCIEKGKLIVTC